MANLVVFAACAAVWVIGGGCDQAAPPPAVQEKIHVVTPVYVIADIVRRIGGERVDATWWIEAGQSLADLQETPARRNQLRSADLIITRGDIDPWTMRDATSEYERSRLIKVDKMYSASAAGPKEYFWLDPPVAMELADAIAERLAAREPEHEKMFRENLAKFRGEVIAVSDQTRGAIDAAVVRCGFLTLDRGFLPLAARFGLNEARVDRINLADPTPFGVKRLKERAKDAGTVAIFVNDQTPATLRRDWEARLGLMVLPLDALGSSAPGSGRATYVQVLKYNLEQVVKGMTAPGSGVMQMAAPSTTPGTDEEEKLIR